MPGRREARSYRKHMPHILKLPNVLQSGWTLPMATSHGGGSHRMAGTPAEACPSPRPRSCFPPCLAAWAADRRRSQQTWELGCNSPHPHPTLKEPEAPPERGCTLPPPLPGLASSSSRAAFPRGSAALEGRDGTQWASSPCQGAARGPSVDPCLWLYWGLAWGLQ